MGGAAPSGGEAFVELFARADDRLNARLRASGRTMVVASPNLVRATVLLSPGAPSTSVSRLDVAPFGVSEFPSDGRARRLRALNSGPPFPLV